MKIRDCCFLDQKFVYVYVIIDMIYGERVDENMLMNVQNQLVIFTIFQKGSSNLQKIVWDIHRGFSGILTARGCLVMLLIVFIIVVVMVMCLPALLQKPTGATCSQRWTGWVWCTMRTLRAHWLLVMRRHVRQRRERVASLRTSSLVYIAWNEYRRDGRRSRGCWPRCYDLHVIWLQITMPCIASRVNKISIKQPHCTMSLWRNRICLPWYWGNNKWGIELVIRGIWRSHNWPWRPRRSRSCC